MKGYNSLKGQIGQKSDRPSIEEPNRSQTMTIRQQAILWLKKHHPSQILNPLRTSRFYPEREIWFFTFPSTFFDAKMEGHVNVMCETQDNDSNFIYLKVPFSFFMEHRGEFNVRANGEKFDLHISGKKKNWLVDERSDGVTFAEFEQ